MEELKKIYNKLIEISPKSSEDARLDCATRIFISNNISRERGNGNGATQPKEDVMISDKQIALLKKLQYKGGDIESLTMAQAFEIIKEMVGK